MKPAMILGIVFIVLGAASLAFRSFSYTTNEKVVDVGGLQVTADTENTFSVPRIAGGLAVVGGIALVVVSTRKP